jgi:hypothetical protein
MNRTAILVLAALLPAGGCSLVEDPSPNEARLVVQGEAGKEVRIIVSSKFVAAVNEAGQTRVVIIESDTVVTTLPFEASYQIEEDQQFFAEAARLEDDVQNVKMQVFVDQRIQFDEGGALMDGFPYRFVYTFNQQITRDIVVL